MLVCYEGTATKQHGEFVGIKQTRHCSGLCTLQKTGNDFISYGCANDPAEFECLEQEAGQSGGCVTGSKADHIKWVKACNHEIDFRDTSGLRETDKIELCTCSKDLCNDYQKTFKATGTRVISNTALLLTTGVACALGLAGVD